MKRQSPFIRVRETSLADSLQDWVPKLRAYAAIATGSKTDGDETVSRVINRLTDEHTGFCEEPGFDFRTFLFELLEDELQNGDFDNSGLQRKAFVLIELEGFSATETAQILGVRSSEIERWFMGLR